MAEMRPYIVRQGDYLAKLADKMGFDADEVWSHAKNQGLKDAGRTPDMLCPGDVLHVPEGSRPQRVSLGGDNPYAGVIRTVHIAVRFQDEGRPLANEAYLLAGVGEIVEGTTKDDGLVECDVPTTCAQVQVSFPAKGLTYFLKVGHLDPPETESGLAQRLQNLGCYAEPESDDGFEREASWKDSALKLLERRRGRAVDTTDPSEDVESAHGS
jgi:hypothetical protein